MLSHVCMKVCLPDTASAFAMTTEIEKYQDVMRRRNHSYEEIQTAQWRDPFCLKRMVNLHKFPKFEICKRDDYPERECDIQSSKPDLGIIGIRVNGRFEPFLPKILVDDVIKGFSREPPLGTFGSKTNKACDF